MVKENFKVYQQEIKIDNNQKGLIEMKKEDYDRMLSDIKELRQYIYNITGMTLEEYKKEQQELQKIYLDTKIPKPLDLTF